MRFWAIALVDAPSVLQVISLLLLTDFPLHLNVLSGMSPRSQGCSSQLKAHTNAKVYFVKLRIRCQGVSMYLRAARQQVPHSPRLQVLTDAAGGAMRVIDILSTRPHETTADLNLLLWLSFLV